MKIHPVDAWFIAIVLGMAIVFSLMYYCSPPEPLQQLEMASDGSYYSIVTISGCQYIKNDRTLTHKANCTNVIHKIVGNNK